MRLQISHRTDVGQVRSSNQDSCSVDILDPRQNAALLVVADGMGGYEGGEIASRLAVEAIRQRVLERAANWAEKGTLGEGLLEAINHANLAILEAQGREPRLTNMGTTVTAALIWGDRVYIGHIGDSKACLIGKKKVRQVTTDHNVAGEMLSSGHLTADQAAVHPQRHVLTRALGITEMPNVERHDLKWTSSELLVLSTDGLSSLVSLPEIQSLAAALPAEELADRLVTLANERGGPDNITVLIARWEG